MKDQRAIEGRNANVRAFFVDGWYPFACVTRIDLNLRTEMIETTSKNSGQWQEYMGRLNSWGGTLETVTHIVPPPFIGTFLTVFNAIRETIRRQGLTLEFSWTDPVGNIKTLTGKALIPDIAISAGADGFSQDTLTLQGTGPLTEGTTIIPTPQNPENIMPYDVRSKDVVGTAGQTVITDSELIGCQLIGVWRGYPLDIVYTGLPTEAQVRITTNTGTWEGVMNTGVLQFGAPLGVDEFVYYIFKKFN